MKRLLTFLASLAVLASLVIAIPAQGAITTFITSNGDIDMKAPPSAQNPVSPPLIDMTRLGLPGGRLFTNQIDGAGPFAVGSHINTIGEMQVLTAIDGTSSPALLPDGSVLAVVFAVQGTIVSNSSGVVVAAFNTGELFLTSSTTGNPAPFFDLDHPGTWNAGNAFAQFSLLPQQNVVDGTALGIDEAGHTSAFAAQTDLSAVNSVNQQQQQGIFLFQSASTALQNAGLGFLNPGLSPAFYGDNWLQDVDPIPGRPDPGLPDGIAGFVNQTALSSVPNSIGADASNLTGADLVALNNIALNAGFVGAIFATGFGAGPATNFDPKGIGSASPTGDFVADISADAYIGYTDVVPEPSSFCVIGVAFAVAGLCRARRKLGALRAAE